MNAVLISFSPLWFAKNSLTACMLAAGRRMREAGTTRPFRKVELDIMYGEGVSKLGEMLDLGVHAGVVEKSGSWFSAFDERIGQGRENAKKYLKENPEIAGKVEDAIRRNAGLLSDALLDGPGDLDGEDS